MYLSHYNALMNLPDYLQDGYIKSRTNTCQVYRGNWELIDKEVTEKGDRLTITNKVIEVEGWVFYKQDNVINKRKEK
jgi:hypothetical protein